MIRFSRLLSNPASPEELESISEETAVNGEEHESAQPPVPDGPEAPVEQVQVQPSSRIIAFTDPRSPGADRFRYLGMRLRELRAAKDVTSVVVTSPLPQDGKTTVAMNLATTLASSGKHPVLLIEADLHRPSVANTLGITPRPGLAECLEKDLDPMTALLRIEPLGWHLLQAGKPVGNPTDLLQSDLLPTILERVTSHFDWVVIDSPPTAPLTDAVSLSRHADATLLVVRAGDTPREAVEETVATIGSEHIAGLVLNADEGLNHSYSKYKGYYGGR